MGFGVRAAVLGVALAMLPRPVDASSIDRTLIRSIVRAHLSEIRACYEAGLARNPALAGTLVLAFTIAPSGAVIDAHADTRELGDAAVGTCIARAALAWRFPGHTGGAIHINYPFVLSPRAELKPSRTPRTG